MLSLSPIDVPEVTINNEPGQETTFHPHVEPNTLIYVRQQRGSPPSSSSNTVQLGTGPGTLFICSDSLIWRQDNTGQGWRLTYPQISLHAISKDLDAFPHECLYLMLDDLSENGHGNGIADSKVHAASCCC